MKSSEKRLKNLRPWKSGQSGNPKGHSKGVRHWHKVFAEMFESGKITQDEICRALAKRAAKGDHQAAKIIFDRMDGKPKETVVTTEKQDGINLESLPSDLRLEVLRELADETQKEIKAKATKV